MKKPLLIAAMVLAALSPAQAQKDLSSTGLPPHRNCGTAAPDITWDQWMNTKVQEYQDNVAAGRSSAVVSYTIPVRWKPCGGEIFLCLCG